jgi:C4-dicarboxylate transporter DctM subunit
VSATSVQAVLIVFPLLFLLLFWGVPIAWTLLVSAILGFAIVVGIDKSLSVFNYTVWSIAGREGLVCLPLFLIMGHVVFESGLGEKLFRLASSFVGQLRGGLGMALSIACGLFGAVSGSIFAALGTLGPTVIPEMAKFRYNKNFAAAILACSGTFASMIPPSIALIIYGFLTETSISKLFMAGLIPGIMTVVVYCFTIYLMVKIKPSLAPEHASKASWRQRGQLTVSNIPLGCVALLVLGGIYLGWFTPTESAGIGLFLVLALAVAMRRIGLKGIVNSFITPGRTVAMIIFLLIGGFTLAQFTAITRVTFVVSEFIVDLGLSPYLLAMVIYIFYIILGCFLDASGMMILTVPIVFPAMVDVGFDPIWFGVFIVKVCEIAVVTPPIGVDVYITESIVKDQDVRSEQIFRYVTPFVLADTFVIALFTAFPQICLWLPGTMS